MASGQDQANWCRFERHHPVYLTAVLTVLHRNKFTQLLWSDIDLGTEESPAVRSRNNVLDYILTCNTVSKTRVAHFAIHISSRKRAQIVGISQLFPKRFGKAQTSWG